MLISEFSAPGWFVLAVLLGALVAGYLIAQRRRRHRTLRFANLTVLERTGAITRRRTQHLPAALLLISLLTLTTAMAGPMSEQKVPRNRATVIMAIDVSLSMGSGDVQPSRIAAAQESAKQFIEELTPGINLGIISFAGTASVLVAPTTERAGARNAIEKLQLAESTATGEAILSALRAIEGVSAIVSGPDGPPPAHIVLLSDGKQTVPNSPEDPRGAYPAAREARDVGVPISTISFGTEAGTIEYEGETLSVPVDDEMMTEIAQLSGGEFHQAATAEDLQNVYHDLGEQIGYEVKQTDASKPWIALGVVALIAAAASSLIIGQRMP